MKLSKSDLEKLIAQKKTLGTYIFDEKKECFFGSAEIELFIAKKNGRNFESVMYYFDGYEIWLEDHQTESYVGDELNAKKMAIESFNTQPELFMGFPIFYASVSCHVHESE